MIEHDLHDAIHAAVEPFIHVRGLVQRCVMSDDLAGPGPTADDQVAQVRGVPAIVHAPESDGNALVEQGGPRHVQRPVGVTAVRRWCRVGGGEHTCDAHPSCRIDQAGQVADDLTRILPIQMITVAGLEPDRVDSAITPLISSSPGERAPRRARASSRICSTGSPWRASTGTNPISAALSTGHRPGRPKPRR
jgi:hypothetical protein